MRHRRFSQGRLAKLTGLSKASLAHCVFWLGILFKAADGVLETASGVVLLTISDQTIVNITYKLVAPELAEDPNDWLANHLLYWANHLSADAKAFAIAFLLVHGIAKLIIVTAIWFSQLWAYWLAGIVFSLFAVYQMARFTVTHSMMMLLLTAVDLVIIALLPPEYRRLSREIQGRAGERSQEPSVPFHQG